MARASDGYSLETGASDRAVQATDDIWLGVLTILQELDEHVSLSQAAGLALSGAMHSLVPVTHGGQALDAALTWADNRAAAQASHIREEVDSRRLYERTGCPVQATYHPARLRWWLQEGAPAGTDLFVGLKEWVLHRLTGVWATDYGMASTTGLLDIRRQLWDDEALAVAGIMANCLPPLVSASAQIGRVTDEAAAATGLPPGMPVFAGSHDGGLANLGAGAGRPGDVALTVGTSGAIRKVVSTPQLDPAMRTWCYLLDEALWLAGGAINNGGLVVHWLRDQFFRDVGGDWRATTGRFMKEAASVPAGADGVLVLPYLAGERTPHWETDGRATIHGLQLGHGRAHVARAALEAVAFCLADVWLALHQGVEMPRPDQPIRLTGGITAWPVWVQIVADVLGMPVMPVKRADASALGAALVAQYGLGWRNRPFEAADNPPESQMVAPSPERHALYAARHEMFQVLYRQTRAL